MTELPSIEYPHWLMIVGVLLLMLGFIGLAVRRRGVEAEPLAMPNDQRVSEPADLNERFIIARRRRSEGSMGRQARRHGTDRCQVENPGRKMSVLIHVDTAKSLICGKRSGRRGF
jgi:hypothetical protein